MLPVHGRLAKTNGILLCRSSLQVLQAAISIRDEKSKNKEAWRGYPGKIIL
jgi:hypothetical protein